MSTLLQNFMTKTRTEQINAVVFDFSYTNTNREVGTMFKIVLLHIVMSSPDRQQGRHRNLCHQASDGLIFLRQSFWRWKASDNITV